MARRRITGIIMDVVTKQYVEFVGWEPPQASRVPVYNDESVRGRSEPYSFYSHTGPRVWPFRVHFVASLDQGDKGIYESVKEKVNFVESLVLPDYGVEPGELSIVTSPHYARIRIRRLVDAVGTIRNFSVEYPGPYDVDTGYSQTADCSFELQEQHAYDQNIDSMSSVRRSLVYGQTKQE